VQMRARQLAGLIAGERSRSPAEAGELQSDVRQTVRPMTYFWYDSRHAGLWLFRFVAVGGFPMTVTIGAKLIAYAFIVVYAVSSLCGCEKVSAPIPPSAIVGIWSYSGDGGNVTIEFRTDRTYQQVVTTVPSNQRLEQTGEWVLQDDNLLGFKEILMYDEVGGKWIKSFGVWTVFRDSKNSVSIRGGTVNDPDYDVTLKRAAQGR